ncbi:MAG TPA: D-alanyl-D-alanine carboxypeptidase/D-alanyl-D-alanine-endopeptidase [Gemmatimonadales bacterium]
MRISLLLAWMLAGSANAQVQANDRIAALLDRAPFDHALWGVLVVDDHGDVVFARNADRLFTPASTSKLIVSAAASALLRPRFTVTTTVYGSGTFDSGVLRGDLIVYGRGDPTFSAHCYATATPPAGACDSLWTRMGALAETLARRGLRHVTGAIVGDGSYFEPQLLHPAWQMYDVNWHYAAPVSALGFNDNSVNVIWSPGPSPDAPARIRFEPDLAAFTFENRTTTVEAGGESTIDFYRKPGTMQLWAEGTVARGARERTEYFALPDPNLYFVQALRAALRARGISIAGPDESATGAGRVCADCVVLAEFDSRPVEDWVYAILNTSENGFSEMLLKVLGRELRGEGSWEAGLEVERAFLVDSVGIDPTHFALADGSGLARQNLLSPRALVQLLRFMRDHPNGAAFHTGLAVGGASGTLSGRFRDATMPGRVVAKTGSIDQANTLAGYVEQPNGRHLTFAIMLNHHTASFRAAVNRIDAIVREAAQSYPF